MDAAPCEACPLFQVQVRHQQSSIVGHIECPRQIRDQAMLAQADDMLFRQAVWPL